MKIIAFFLITAVSFVSAGEPKEQIRFAMVDSSPSTMVERFSPFMTYLSDHNYDTTRIKVFKTLNEMTAALQTGQVNLTFESPAGALQFMNQASATPVLIRAKKGTVNYRSVIFVKNDSNISSFSELAGKVIAFEDPSSSSSYLMPFALLKESGLELIESKTSVEGKLAYYFSGDDKNTIAQVTRGRNADAGGIKENEVTSNDRLRILSPVSDFVPRHVVLVGKELDTKTLKHILLSMRNDPAAQDILLKMNNPTGFFEFEGDPNDLMLGRIKHTLGYSNIKVIDELRDLSE
jgi:phosphonate transport system substrate-binding protein